MANFEVLILDEPCAGLDPVARAKFLVWLKELLSLAQGPSIVLVTHHVEEIVEPLTHVLLLKSGQVLFQGQKAMGMTETWLSRVYDAELELLNQDERYELKLKAVSESF